MPSDPQNPTTKTSSDWIVLKRYIACLKFPGDVIQIVHILFWRILEAMKKM